MPEVDWTKLHQEQEAIDKSVKEIKQGGSGGNSRTKDTTNTISQPQETPTNIFGYQQGTIENPITKDTQPSTTPQQRASQAAQDVQIRATMPVATATIPRTSHLSLRSQQEEKKTTGTYTAVEPPKNVFESMVRKGEQALYGIEKESGFKPTSPYLEPKKYASQTIKSIAPSTQVFTGELVTHPYKTGIIIGSGIATGLILKNPSLGVAAGEVLTASVPLIAAESLYGFKEERRTGGTGVKTVITTTGEFALFGEASKIGSAAGTKLLNVGLMPAFEKVTVPTATGEKTIFKGITLGEKAIGYNKANLPKDIMIEKFTPETKFETRVAGDIAEKIYVPSEAQKFELGTGLVKETYGTKSIYKRELPLETKTLGEKGVKEVLTFAKKEKGLLYGSYTAEPQLPEGVLGKGRGLAKKEIAIGDIDVQLKSGQEATEFKTQDLLGKLTKAGETVRISKETPTLIESFKGGEWKHAVDIHSKDVSLDVDIPSSRALGYEFGQKNVKRGGQDIMSLSEFQHRKAASSLTLRAEGISPEPHRAKDIPDLLTSTEYLLRSKGAKPESFKKLEALREIYRKEGALPAESTEVLLYAPKESAKASPYVLPSTRISPSRSPSKAPSSISASISPSIKVSPSVSPGSYSISPSISSKPSQKPSVSQSISKSIGSRSVPSPSTSYKGYSVSQSISAPSVSSYPTSIPTSKPSPKPSSEIGGGIVSPPPLFGAGGLDLTGTEGRGKYTKAPKYGYTASVEAQIFNIRGTKGKGYGSGLTVRPIAKYDSKATKVFMGSMFE